jgi:hypothetical protein
MLVFAFLSILVYSASVFFIARQEVLKTSRFVISSIRTKN